MSKFGKIAIKESKRRQKLIVDHHVHQKIRQESFRDILGMLVDESLHQAGKLGSKLQDLERRQACNSAVLILLDKISPSQEIVDHVANKYLDYYKAKVGPVRRAGRRLLFWSDILASACHVIEFGASKDVANAVIAEVLDRGWLQAENMILKFMSRGLNADEVDKLVDHYVNDLGFQSDRHEEGLRRLASKYLDPSQVDLVEKKIQDFTKKWKLDSCIY